MNIKTRPVEYKHGKTTCIGYLAWDDNIAEPKPCVLINHAWGGRDGFAEDKAIEMAALGYVGFALDNYGDAALPESIDGKKALMTPLVEDRQLLIDRLKAGYKAAAKLDEVDETHMAAMGFCFGGLCTLDMARSGMKLKAAMSFHGLLGGHELPKKKIKAKVLVAHGWEDPMAPPSDVVALGKELGEAKCDWQLLAYGNVQHGFMVPSANDKKLGIVYDADASRRAWMNTLELLQEVFGMHRVNA
ncbi:dienelactone hydrolase family protein [Litorimonas sp. RW-G-Af-16]|uniref:dienelactone hydrolase family protein n=1 Tax=Litorimonas sp. RW-G-Af-16 TaxID=3241168 RepID=UPI00390CC2E0